MEEKGLIEIVEHPANRYLQPSVNFPFSRNSRYIPVPTAILTMYQPQPVMSRCSLRILQSMSRVVFPTHALDTDPGASWPDRPLSLGDIHFQRPCIAPPVIYPAFHHQIPHPVPHPTVPISFRSMNPGPAAVSSGDFSPLISLRRYAV